MTKEIIKKNKNDLQIKKKALNLHHQNKTDPWCNGSTLVFGTISWGSNPCGST